MADQPNEDDPSQPTPNADPPSASHGTDRPSEAFGADRPSTAYDADRLSASHDAELPGAVHDAYPPSAAVFDLDGVLADVRHRLHHVAARPKDWEAFFAAAIADPPLTEGLAAVAEAASNGHRIVYLTGRPERCRADTTAWLAEHGLPDGELFMRADTDRRPARFTKVARLRGLAKRMRVAMLVDDDVAVVHAVRAAGFPVRHATWMPDEPVGTTDEPGSPDAQAVLFDVQESEGRT